MPPPRYIKISKRENLDYFFWYPDSVLEDSQNLMRSKLDQDQSSIFFSGRSKQ